MSAGPLTARLPARRRARSAPAPTLPAPALLQLMWLASPALPVGGFSYSEGLEAAIDAGLVADEASTRDWLLDHLHLVLARGDLAVVARAVPAWQRHDVRRLAELNAWVLATRETAESRLQTEQMGRSLVDWLRPRTGLDPAWLATLASFEPQPAYPVAWAAAAATVASVTPRDAALAYAFGWAENMVQAALKAVPLGQAAGQRVLSALVAELPHAVAHAAALPDSLRLAHAPGLAILGARHETQYSRLFRS